MANVWAVMLSNMLETTLIEFPDKNLASSIRFAVAERSGSFDRPRQWRRWLKSIPLPSMIICCCNPISFANFSALIAAWVKRLAQPPHTLYKLHRSSLEDSLSTLLSHFMQNIPAFLADSDDLVPFCLTPQLLPPQSTLYSRSTWAPSPTVLLSNPF